jgi:hypothetical protein
MLNLLGLQFPGWTGEGLKVSYDKDDRSFLYVSYFLTPSSLSPNP